MYTVKWAENFSGFPKGQTIDLQQFMIFFEEHIENKTFIYETNSSVLSSFSITPKGNQLPHLMGLQYWNRITTKNPSKQYENLRSGEWDISFLEKADNGSYKENISRIEFLPFLYNLLYYYDCTIKPIHKDVYSPFRNRKMDMIFQKEANKSVYCVELREKHGHPGVFDLSSLSVYRPKASALQFKSNPLKIANLTVK